MFGLGLNQLEGLSVVLFQGGVLIFFAQDNITNNEQFCLCAHKATKGNVWSTNNRLTAHVKAGIHNNRATGASFKFCYQRMIYKCNKYPERNPPK